MTPAEKLDAAIKLANELVISTSIGIMTVRTEAERSQARFFQGLFSSIRDVLSAERSGYWEDGTAPEEWERFATSRAALALADAVLADPMGDTLP